MLLAGSYQLGYREGLTVPKSAGTRRQPFYLSRPWPAVIVEQERTVNPLDAERQLLRFQRLQSLDVFDWLARLPLPAGRPIRRGGGALQNTRKEFYRNGNALQLLPGDLVTVDAAPGLGHRHGGDGR